MPFFHQKQLYFDNNSLHYSKQDIYFDFLLAFFILALPFSALSEHGRLLLFFALSFLFLKAIFIKKARISFSKAHFFLLCFFTTAIAGLFKNPDLLSLLSVLLWMLAAFFLRNNRAKNILFPRMLAITGGCLGLFAIGEIFGGAALSLWSDTARFGILARASFPFGNPNLLGAFLAPSAIFALSEGLHTSQKRRFFYLILFSLSVMGLLLTYCRGAWLGCLGGVALLLWKKRKPSESKLACAVPALPFLKRFLSCFSPDSSVSYRFSLWRSIAKVPLRKLFFGVGEGKKALYALLSPYMAAGLEHVEHTHSLYFHLVTAEGLLGLFLFFAFLFFRYKRPSPHAHHCALLSLLIYGIFDDPLYSGQIGVLFWLLVNAN